MINRIKVLHENQLLHRDIKPSNFLFGLEKDTNKLYLVDFGFSKRYIYNGNHIQERELTKIVGSPNFVSLNIHNHIEPSRRDDLESCIYIMLTMLFGKLVWFDKSNLNDIYKLKEQIILIEEVPTFIKILLNYVRKMKFDETPDYNYIINVIIETLKNNLFENDNKFEWN